MAGDHPRQRPPVGQDVQPFGGEFHHAGKGLFDAGDDLLQPGRGHAHVFRHPGEGEAEIAHQRLDDAAADAVVFGEGMAARGGQPALAHRRLVARGGRVVLRIALPVARNRRGADADQGVGGVFRVALEVAVQPAFAPGHRQPVLGAGEMVDADLLVAVPDEQLSRRLEQREALFGGGQGIGGNEVLPLGHPGHMGIAVKRHPVGREAEHLLHALGDALFGLVGQAVEDVHVQAGDAAGADRLDGGAGFLVALGPADGVLDLGVEILHADGGAVHARCGQRVKARLVDLVGVDLHRKLGAFGQRRHGEDRFGQIAHQRGRKQRRRATAPVKMLDLHTGGEKPGYRAQL